MPIHGITVTLHERIETGARDSLNRPVCESAETTVENVLVQPLSEQEVTDTLSLTGKKAVYRLFLPKGDKHTWADMKVTFWGQDWRVVGDSEEYIEDLVPLAWNKMVRVEKVDG